MKIEINIPIKNRAITLDVEPSDSIQNVKTKIYDKEGIPAEEQILQFGTCDDLIDKLTLNDYNIKNGSRVHLYSIFRLNSNVESSESRENVKFKILEQIKFQLDLRNHAAYTECGILASDSDEKKEFKLTKKLIESTLSSQAVEIAQAALNNPNYVSEILNNYNSIDEFINDITPVFNENTAISEEEGNIVFSLYGDALLNYFGDFKNPKAMEESSEYFWKILILNEKVEENEKFFFQTIVKDLKILKSEWNCDLFQKDNLENQKIEIKETQSLIDNTKAFMKCYTSNNYRNINGTFGAIDPIKRSKISYLFNMILSNFQKNMIKEINYSEDIVYRGLTLDSIQLNLYKKGGVLMYTHLLSTSKSKEEAEGFAKKSWKKDKKKIMIIIQMKLLCLDDQKKRKFFSGFNVKNISFYPEEEEILIFPYQFFKITEIEMTEKNLCSVFLDQLYNNDIIEKIIGNQIIKKPKNENKNEEFKSDITIEGLRKRFDLTKERLTEKKQKIESFRNELEEEKSKIFNEPHITIKASTGYVFAVDFNPNDSIANIKSKIQDKQYIPPEQQKLSFAGKI